MWGWRCQSLHAWARPFFRGWRSAAAHFSCCSQDHRPVDKSPTWAVGERRWTSAFMTHVVLRKLPSSVWVTGLLLHSHRFPGERGVPWAPFGQDSKLLFTSLIFPLVGWLLFLNPKPLPVSNVPSESRCCCPADDRGQRLFLPESLPGLQPAVTPSEDRALLPLSRCWGLVAGPSRSQQDAPASPADLGLGCFSTNILSALFPTAGKVFTKPVLLRAWVKRAS